jgi:hypothetical protein
LQSGVSNESEAEYVWVIPPEATKTAGDIKFSICLITIDAENHVISRWNSNPCEVLTVGKGMYLPEIDDITIIESTEIGEISQEELTAVLQEVFGT